MMYTSIVVTLSLFAFAGAVPFSQQTSNKDPVQPRYAPENTLPDKATNKGESTEKEGQLPTAQVLENPAYDPNLYSSFIPQDSVQQYVSTYGGPYTPGAYVPGFAIQSGYEGYLFPELQTTEVSHPGVIKYVTDLLPRSLAGWFIRIGVLALTTLGVIFFGGAVTSALCSLTQICSLSFASPPFFKWRNAAETIGKALDGDFTIENIEQTAQLVKAAIETYSAMQDDAHGEGHKAKDL